MSWSHLLSLVLGYLRIADTAGWFYLEQPATVIWKQAGEAVVLPCKVVSYYQEIDIQYQWFAFKKDSHHEISWNATSNYRLEEASLVITSLHVADSGIYHCAALVNGAQAPGAQLVSDGTTLIVRERQNMMWHILLWSLLILLVICNTAIMIFIYHKKSNSKNRQFRVVLQELYNKRKTDDKREASPNKAESLQSGNSIHDIYQNL